MRRLWLIFSQAVTVAVAVLFVVATLKPEWLPSQGFASGARPVLVQQATPGRAGQVALGFADAAQRASPSVVSIISVHNGRPNDNPHANEEWFKYFFGDEDPGEKRPEMGSGVIVSPDGYLLTNNHVVQSADSIEVVLSDGRRTAAKVVGTDPDSDLAVLKIDLPKLPAITFGDASALRVGDAVLAIGNPFNVGQTVTAGIVSALGRQGLGLNTFENFIQTDAAINPGNSGGALVDANGNLMGINTAIYSNSGGSLGIGFAIPVSTARFVLDGIVRDGIVTRGWIGVAPRDVTPEMVETLGLSVDKGVLISGVLQQGPASAAGMKPGDVVTNVAGTEVQNTAQLLNAVAALKPKSKAKIKLRRGGDSLELTVVVAQRPRQQDRPAQ